MVLSASLSLSSVLFERNSKEMSTDCRQQSVIVTLRPLNQNLLRTIHHLSASWFVQQLTTKPKCIDGLPSRCTFVCLYMKLQYYAATMHTKTRKSEQEPPLVPVGFCSVVSRCHLMLWLSRSSPAYLRRSTLSNCPSQQSKSETSRRCRRRRFDKQPADGTKIDIMLMVLCLSVSLSLSHEQTRHTQLLLARLNRKNWVAVS